MNDARIQLSADQTADWAVAEWRAGYLAGLQRFVAANIVRVEILAAGGAVLGTYERGWSVV